MTVLAANRSGVKPEMIPWDPNSEEQVERMIQQRRACGWGAEKIPIWAEEQRAGTRCAYWLALPQEYPDREKHMEAHIKKYPEEATPIQDTAISLRKSPREPTHKSFIPIGHISLDDDNPDAAYLNLDLPTENILWIKALYVSYAMQGGGIGRNAMDAVEAMATGPPLNARTIVLDTLEAKDQMRPDFALGMFGTIVKMSNQEWYERRGYRLFLTVQNHYKVPDRNGKHWDMKTVFLRKDLV